MSERAIHSQHIFIFPFAWELRSSKASNRFNISQVDEYISGQGIWEKYKFRETIEDKKFNTYNTYQYFYEFSRDVLNLSHLPENDVVAIQYQCKFNYSEPKYIIDILGNPSLELDIKDLMLSFYEHGVGLMAFHLINRKTDSFDQILKINEYGRRIYPQFLGSNPNEYVKDTKLNFLANKIVLKNIFIDDVTEDFDDFNTKINCALEPKHIFRLLGYQFVGKEPSPNQCLIKPILDDRMFVISHIFNDSIAEKLSSFDTIRQEYSYLNDPELSKQWYRYVFVDDSKPSCRSMTMLRKLLENHTYDRWIDSNKSEESQIYGISRYSYVALTGTGWFNRNILFYHISYQYFDLVLLCLIQRAYILRLGNEVARISKGLKIQGDKESIRHVSNLYLQFIKFRNRIYFREVTPQEQGIEIYDMLQSKMRIKEDVELLSEEIGELNSYIETLEQGKLSKVANDFLPITLLAALFGMSTIDYGKQTPKWNTILIGFSILIFIWSVVLVFKKYAKLIKWRW